MRPEERLLCLMDAVSDNMLEEALRAGNVQRKRRKILFGLAAAACIVMLFVRFVPAGQVMAAQLRESLENLLEELFPPKDISVSPEGMEEIVTHEIYSDLPEQDKPLSPEESLSQEEPLFQESEKQTNFVIYFDTDSYETAEEDGCYIIRPKRIVYTRDAAMDSISALLEGLSEEEAEQKIQERMEEGQHFYDTMVLGEIRITRMPEMSPENAAQEIRRELLTHYVNVSDVTESSLPEGLYLRADEGTAADCEVKEIYFVDDGSGGTYIITASYPVEQAEGHGTRFRSMIETFEVIWT